jgi:glycosyltransferase involved in cell wall biosynthesis
LGKLRPVETVPPSVSPKLISVIVTAYNDAENLKRLLPQLFSRGKVATQVIVIDMGSSDDSPAIAENYGCEVVTIHNTSSIYSKMRAKIIASKKAQSDILIFLDANVSVSRNALNRLVTALKSCDVVSVYPYIQTRSFTGGMTYVRHILAYAASGVFSFTPKKVPALNASAFAVKSGLFNDIFGKERITPCLAEGLCFADYFKKYGLKMRCYSGGGEIGCVSDGYIENLILHNGKKIVTPQIRLNKYSLAVYGLMLVGGMCIFINLAGAFALMRNITLWLAFYMLYAFLHYRYTREIGAYPVYVYALFPVCIIYFFVEGSFALKNQKPSVRYKIKLKTKANA